MLYLGGATPYTGCIAQDCAVGREPESTMSIEDRRLNKERVLMKLLAFALWFMFLGHGVQLAFAQESASPVATPSAAVDPYTGGVAPEADSFPGAHYPPYTGVCLTPGTIA